MASTRAPINAHLFSGDHHQAPRENSQCQKGREEEADDEREDSREGMLASLISNTIHLHVYLNSLSIRAFVCLAKSDTMASD